MVSTLNTRRAFAPTVAKFLTTRDGVQVKIPSSSSSSRHLSHFFEIGNLRIRVFKEADKAQAYVAGQLVQEFQKPGLIILPADSTHGDKSGEIFPMLDNFFRIKSSKSPLSPNLRITHMDELLTEDIRDSQTGPFATQLTKDLPTIIQKLGARFFHIDPNALERYNNFVDCCHGPRVIVGGVGAEVPPHIAYIGEETDGQGRPILNDEAKLVTLRDQEAKRRNVRHAATMGMKFFKNRALERVIITATGERKAKALLYAFQEAFLNQAPQGRSALGTTLYHFRRKNDSWRKRMTLVLDEEAFQLIAKDEELMNALKRNQGGALAQNV